MSKQLVNVYDFDHTIYRGDASIDFIVYCMLRQPGLWKYLPGQALALARYIFGSSSRKQLKQQAFVFLKGIDDIDGLTTAFWNKREAKIAAWYQQQHQQSDIIISASAEFLLRPIAKRLGVRTLIATRMDSRTGRISGQNCRGQEKVRRLHQYDSSLDIGEFYSDSMTDRPLFELASQPFVVSRQGIVPLAEYKPPKSQALKSRAFLRFLAVGGVNAFLGILFSFIISLITNSPLLSFAVGFSISLVISYFLNAIVTFKETSFSLGQFGRFCLSYLPNFIILLVVVHILADILGLYPLVAYILAAVIAVPVTFLLLSKFTFIKGGKR